MFDACSISCDLLLDRLILEAQNTRYLITKIEYADLKPRVRKYWIDDLESLLDEYTQLCVSIKPKSFKYYHYMAEMFAKLYARNDSVMMAETPEISDIVAHYKNTTARLKSAISSDNGCLKDSGPIIDRIKQRGLLGSRLLQSLYL